MKSIRHVFLALTLAAAGLLHGAEIPGRWTPAQANDWGKKAGWLAGCNFTPSSAINQLEMWQADTFDPATIDRELGWAENLGFNSMRVFLHNLAWQEDAKGFVNHMDQLLGIAQKHHIRIMFVFFDSCWNPDPKLGKQPDPKPFVHNSGWVQSPGAAYLNQPARLDELKPYVQDVIGHFRADDRIAFWDLFNEPDNGNGSSYGKTDATNKLASAILLLQKTFAWAREMKPTQPLSSGVWQGNWADPARLSVMEQLQLENSDIITFHNYSKLDDLQKCVQNLRRYDRPIICTEYMARPNGSTFDPMLRFFKDQNVGAYNWGFVSGKTQTIFPWDSWSKTYTAEPPLWFHDILRQDGTPYRAQEVDFIRRVTLGIPAPPK